MKKTYLLLITLIVFSNLSLYANKQRYIVLDSISSGLDTHHYTLNTLEMYGVDKDIELFNIYTKQGNLILLSVLPDFSALNNWRRIDMSAITDSLVSRKDFFKTIFRYEGDGFEQNKTFAYNLIIKRDNEFYASINCLFEFFFVVDHPSMFRTAKMTINTGGDIHTMKSTKEKFDKVFGEGMFPVRYTDTNILEQRAMETVYKSGEIVLGKDTAHKFWTFTDWFIGDGIRTYRGIDRFLYIPNKGIVGGSYDFYFRYLGRFERYTVVRTTKSYEELEQNSIDEKIMLAKELQ